MVSILCECVPTSDFPCNRTHVAVSDEVMLPTTWHIQWNLAFDGRNFLWWCQVIVGNILCYLKTEVLLRLTSAALYRLGLTVSECFHNYINLDKQELVCWLQYPNVQFRMIPITTSVKELYAKFTLIFFKWLVGECEVRLCTRHSVFVQTIPLYRGKNLSVIKICFSKNLLWWNRRYVGMSSL